MDLKAEFSKREPWITYYAFDEVNTGGDFHALNDPRVAQFFETFPRVQNILELGSLEGGHTFTMARRPDVTRVVGLEGRAANVEKSRFMQKLFGLTKVEFIEANLENTDLASFGKFDAVFCSGLLYHLPEPWKLIEQIPRVAPNLFIWTHYCDDLAVDAENGELKGRNYVEGSLHRPNSGLSSTSFWLTLGSLIKALTKNGFGEIRILQNNLKHPHGPAVTLAATTSRF
jgi:SAM-dependent methyltransferase